VPVLPVPLQYTKRKRIKRKENFPRNLMSMVVVVVARILVNTSFVLSLAFWFYQITFKKRPNKKFK
jgi:hypothetical protein